MSSRHPKYLEHINAEAHMEIVIRGHLHVEAKLIEAIRLFMVRPDEIDLAARVSFGVKVDLAIALGAVPPEARPAYLALNRLRNRIAHNLEYEVRATDQLEIYAAFDDHLKYLAGFALEEERTDFPEGLKTVISVLYISLTGRIDQIRKSRAEWQQEMERQHREVVEVLGYDPATRRAADRPSADPDGASAPAD